MTHRDIKALVNASYKKDTLDGAMVLKIARMLAKKDLKTYLRALKLAEQQRKVYVAMPGKSVYNTTKKSLEKIFPTKELIFQEDPSLLLGLKVIDNDTVYDMSLAERLESIKEEIAQ